MKSRSLYLPALNTCFLTGITDEYMKTKNRTPSNFGPNQINVFNPQCPFYYKSSLLSAGHEPFSDPVAQYATVRNRQKDTLLVGDSGGFQIATNKLKIDWSNQQNVDKIRLDILRYLETNCDIAMTLDVPTFTIGREGFKFQTFTDCLEQTVLNMDYWMAHRNPESKLRLLNVLQGRNEAEVEEWYSRVKDYDLEGWAFSSANSDCVYYMIRTMLMLARDGQLTEKTNWIHVLGRTMPAVSVILTDLQNRTSELVGTPIQISYDSSSFTQAARTATLLDHELGPELKMRTKKADLSYDAIGKLHMTLSDYVGNTNSKIGDAIFLDDMYRWGPKKTINFDSDHLIEEDEIEENAFCEKGKPLGWGWDIPAYARLMAYNFEVTVKVMELAHDMYDRDELNSSLLKVKYEILPEVFSKGTIDEMLVELERHKSFLTTEILKYTEPAILAHDNGLFDW